MVAARQDRTPDDVEAELAIRRLPDDGPTWLELVERVAGETGALVSEICTPGRRTATTVLARHIVWSILRAAGFSYSEIAAPWGADHTTVMAAVRKLALKEAA